MAKWTFNPFISNFDRVGLGALPPEVAVEYTTDNGDAIPALGVLRVVGQTNGIIQTVETHGSGNTVTVEDLTSTTWLVVDPSSTPGQRGTYQTIESAMLDATPGTTIFLKDGLYIENVALTPGVNITAYNTQFTAGVKIKGKLSMTAAGASTISGVALETNGDAVAAVNGSSASQIYITNCTVTTTDFYAIEMTSTSGASLIRISFCWLYVRTSSKEFFDVSGAGSLQIFATNNSGGSVTSVVSTFSSSGILRIEDSVLRFPFSTSGNGRLAMTRVTVSTVAAPSRKCLHVGGSFSTDGITNYIRHCSLFSGTETAISMSADLDLNNCNISSDNSTGNPPISGTGQLNYSGNTYTFQTFVPSDTTITMLRRPIDGGRYVGDWSGGSVLAGTIGEIIESKIPFGSATSLVSTTPKNVTSIALTAGIWDIVGIVQFSGFTTSTAQVGSLCATSATLGNYGENTVSAGFTQAVDDDVGVVIPSWRKYITPAMVLAGTNIVYLVAKCTFTGACSAYGRISAERAC